MDFTTFDAMAPEEKQYETLVNQTALAAVVPPSALAAIVRRESNWDANARSADGGWGLCQITSGVDNLGIYMHDGRAYNCLDARENLIVAASFFLRPRIDECLLLRKTYQERMDAINAEILYFAFAAFNAGMGAVQSAIEKNLDPDKFTTLQYAAGTLSIYHRYLAMAHAG